MNTVNKYTWLGFSSILIWASLVAVVKLITEQVTPERWSHMFEQLKAYL